MRYVKEKANIFIYLLNFSQPCSNIFIKKSSILQTEKKNFILYVKNIYFI